MGSDNYETDHAQLVRELAPECTLLLKKDGSFPLKKPGKIALFGPGARKTVKGGTGSGEVNSRYFVTIEEGLEGVGFEVTTKAWLDAYDAAYDNARKEFIKEIKARAKEKGVLAVMEGMGAVMPQPEYDIPLEGEGECALYVLSRISGEGSDRNAVKGDILLTDSEVRDILALNESYEKFMLVLNVGGVVDLSPLPDVKNILLLSQLGAETGNILADIVLGKSYPSGKLACTWAPWDKYQSVGDFGNINNTHYREGVFVGYRYFDSVGEEPLFPFGYGLSYTDFETCVDRADESSVTVTVKNTGNYPGKETVQIYIAPPEGKLAKPLRSLAAFAKTKEILPGGSETLTIPYDLKDISSYDEESSSYILESGDYTVFALGTAAVTIRLDKTAALRKVKNLLGEPSLSDWQPENTPKVKPAENIIEIKAESLGSEKISYKRKVEIPKEVSKLTTEDLIKLNIGAFDPKAGAASVIGSASSSVAGAAGETAHIKDFPYLIMADGPAGLRISKDYTKDKKGAHAAGQTMPESTLELLSPIQRMVIKRMGGKKPKGEILHQYCTAIPIGTAIAQSWNTDLARQLGDIVGAEMELFGIDLWLAPALNIQRDIRCGRNFEYFSEDPIISGKFAAAITNGVQAHKGCGTTIKHFAANNQEYNRNFNNSCVSERALREIYLRGFEIAVKESRPAAVMTSYNLINGVHTAESRGLCTYILRSEWGYEGVVMTDWVVSQMVQDRSSANRNSLSDEVARAGGALFMPGSKADYDRLAAAQKAGSITRRQLEENAASVFDTAKRLGKI